MTTDDIERAAEASYLAYHHGRMPVPWRVLSGKDKARWEYVAAKVLNGEALTPRQMREAYFTDYAPWSWENVTPQYRARWQRVWTALYGFVAQTGRQAA